VPPGWTRLALLTVLAALALASPAAAQNTGALRCPSTFQVLHDDRIGQLRLPAGPYTITVLNRSRLSCQDASDLFRQFLEDWDGRLPRPWVLNVGTATFRRGSTGTVGFSVRRASSPSGGGGNHPATGRSCPAFFRVLHNDRIGRLRLRAGRYRITLLAVGRLSCARAARLFASFLQDFDGRLPRPWTLDVETGTFRRGASSNVGFRVKAASGNPVRPSGGGTHPRDGRRCPGTFRVLGRDRIGRLRLPAGPYIITLLRGRGLGCAGASRAFRRFLEDFQGNLPRPWVVSSRTGTFRRGRRSNTGFRVKPVRLVRR
jgi:hypothetical protein